MDRALVSKRFNCSLFVFCHKVRALKRPWQKRTFIREWVKTGYLLFFFHISLRKLKCFGLLLVGLLNLDILEYEASSHAQHCNPTSHGFSLILTRAAITTFIGYLSAKIVLLTELQGVILD